MVPRAVQMNKAVRSIIGPTSEAALGNILGPQGFGWSNLYAQWFLNGPATLGNPALFSYVIHHYNSSGVAFYSQPPIRRNLTLGSCLHPVADNSVPPPLSELSVV